ncbi:hypothetical protein DPMN_099977 [Dreissena polymorpha]|uniref:Uncharacterized protein n=1 Tax=Dreissena polymorpha TaxID=45954 RepID=A0A9D4R8P3_DREPO|nr:hypothetical protein DPMN_099977 [Dreissena polymorpha]
MWRPHIAQCDMRHIASTYYGSTDAFNRMTAGQYLPVVLKSSVPSILVLLETMLGSFLDTELDGDECLLHNNSMLVSFFSLLIFIYCLNVLLLKNVYIEVDKWL